MGYGHLLGLVIEKVLGELRRGGYTQITEIRQLGHCGWFKACKDGQVWEFEVYGDNFSSDNDLRNYIESFKQLPSDLPFLNRPLSHSCSEGYSYILRAACQAQPLLGLLMRPGTVSEEFAVKLLKGFEPIQAYFENYKLESFSPIAVSLTVNDDGQFFMGAFSNGPWIKFFKEVSLIYSFTKSDLDWPKQITYFRNQMALKLLCGEGGDNQQLSPELKRFVSDIHKSPETFKDSIHDYLVSDRKRRLMPFLLILCLLLLTFFFGAKALTKGSNNQVWKGDIYKQPPKVEPSDFISESPPNREVSFGNDNFALLYNQMLFAEAAGEYLKVSEFLKKISAVKLSEGERSKLETFENNLADNREAYFHHVESIVQKLSYQQRLKVLDIFISKQAVDSMEWDRAFSLREKFIKEHVQASKVKLLEKDLQRLMLKQDQQLILALENRLMQPLKRPLFDLSLIDKKMKELQPQLSTKEGGRLYFYYAKILEAERLLYRDLYALDELALSEAFKNLVKGQDKFKDAEVIRVSEVGFDYRDSSGGAFLKFESLTSLELYQLFKFLSIKRQSITQTELYLYCLKYNLHKEKKLIKQNITDDAMLAVIEDLNQFSVVRNRLFKEKE